MVEETCKVLLKGVKLGPGGQEAVTVILRAWKGREAGWKEGGSPGLSRIPGDWWQAARAPESFPCGTTG